MSTPPRWDRRDTGTLAALAVAVLAWRVPQRVPGFVSFDAGVLAMAVEQYDFASYQPHPPYYPLVIALARLLEPALGPWSALAWLTLLAGAAMVAGTYAVARRAAGRPTALLAAALVAASPIVARNTGVPLSYALEGAAGCAVALAAWACRQHPGRLRAVALGVVLSLAVGIRPSSAILLAPIGLWAVWRRPSALAWAGLAGAIATALWLAPAVHAGGGWADFRYGLAFQQRYILVDPAWRGGWASVANRTAWVAWHARAEWAVLGGAALLAAVAAARLRSHWPAQAAALLAVWLLPGLAFYLLVYAGWPVYADGYLMALVPPAMLAAALAVRAFALAAAEPGVPRGAQAVAAAVVVLLLAPALPWARAAPSDEALQWQDSLAGLEQAFPANDTVLLTFYDAAWLRLEHPQHVVWSLGVFERDGLLHTAVQESRGLGKDVAFFDTLRAAEPARHPVPEWARRVAIVQGHPLEPSGPLVQGVALRTTTLAGGAVVPWFDAPDGDIEDVLSYVQAGPIPFERRIQPPA